MDDHLPPAAERVLEVLADAQRFICAPVPTVLVADVVGWPPRTVRHYLAQAERAGRVSRPRGVKSGWMRIL